MPVTAILSRAVYEKLGDEVANQLVDWFNLVDAAYKSDLREQNERNLALFEAKLELHLAKFRTAIATDLERLLQASRR